MCLLPSGILMLILSPVPARLINRWGSGRVLALAGVILAVGLLVRIVLVSTLWQVIAGSAVIGIGTGTGIGYAALPSLINAYNPGAELAAATGLNSLARSLGSTLASAVGGSLLSAITVSVGGTVLPSLTAYRVLFTICMVASSAPWLTLVRAFTGDTTETPPPPPPPPPPPHAARPTRRRSSRGPRPR